ncbi:rna 2' 3'-cyclic phosphodiesterase [Lucifera butyrica]|uniref:RNA 2',3'-cyclic phosphodiesterase n=1 Tax=Lucifera butyrica TaxID=1351585 RepID=A0A498R6Y0_9FIRM|nr:rna 2' 3'-cyclic phosphodiesterase [Lucifera butyrica]
MERGDFLRLFIAIELPEEIIAELDRLRTGLAGEINKARFVDRSNLHITLQFLGEMEPAMVGKLTDQLRCAALQQRPFVLRLGKPGVFGGKNPFRVLWIGLEGDTQALGTLRSNISAALTGAGFPVPGNNYQPHITLAREIYFINSRPVRRDEIDCSPAGKAFPVERFSLLESTVIDRRRRYCPLATFFCRIVRTVKCEFYYITGRKEQEF